MREEALMARAMPRITALGKRCRVEPGWLGLGCASVQGFLPKGAVAAMVWPQRDEIGTPRCTEGVALSFFT
jgi:hypothetical protein